MMTNLVHHWNESEGCCKACFNRIMDTVENAWVATHDFEIDMDFDLLKLPDIE